ncbi:hypothetical protein OS493_021256 [Desmophyllum pertusum]|uniref:Uncharacterized protein n=1 Tax=Desmophyllum pertusum TaxID=174260 RepID=A0A9W9ZRF0_9CNID|nr:hypothetical protein OS493_021256 [Desmophyllum pertusum]
MADGTRFPASSFRPQNHHISSPFSGDNSSLPSKFPALPPNTFFSAIGPNFKQFSGRTCPTDVSRESTRTGHCLSQHSKIPTSVSSKSKQPAARQAFNGCAYAQGPVSGPPVAAPMQFPPPLPSTTPMVHLTAPPVIRHLDASEQNVQETTSQEWINNFLKERGIAKQI